MSGSLPHFARTAEEPTLADDEIGLRIASPGPSSGTTPRVWPIHGRFRVPASEAAAPPEETLRRIVIVLTEDASYEAQARPALADELVFPEDVEDSGGFVSASFHLDLFTLFEIERGQETYHLVATLGEHASNSLTLDVVA